MFFSKHSEIQHFARDADVVLINNDTLEMPIPPDSKIKTEKKIQEFSNAELMVELAKNRQLIETVRKREAIKDGFAFASGRLDAINWGDVNSAFRDHADWIRKCNELETEWQLRISMAVGSLLFVFLGAPVGILFAKRDFLSAFMTCFLPIIGLYYPLMLVGTNLSKEGLLAPDLLALDRQRPAGRPGRVRLAVGREALTRLDAATSEEENDRANPRRQRYWSFFKAYVICYVSLVGLFIVIDAFSNLDEFAKRADGVVEMSQVMGRYYLIHQSLVLRLPLRRDRHDGGDLHRDLDAAQQRTARHPGRRDQHAPGDSPGLDLVGDREHFRRGQPRADHAALRRGAGEIARRRRPAHGSRLEPLRFATVS